MENGECKTEKNPEQPKHELEDEEWQIGCRSLNHRYAELLRRQLWTDCEFVVGAGSARAAAHRVVLAAASPVFAAMLYGPLAASSPDGQMVTVTIIDMEIETFQLLLKYIYTEDIKVESCDLACSLWNGAHMYMLPNLQAICKAFLLSNVTPASVLQVYEWAKLFEEEDLLQTCMKVMRDDTSGVLETGKPEEAKLETLIELFSLDSLTVDSEMDLVKALEWYAVAHAERDQDENIKSKVKEEKTKGKETRNDKLTVRDALKQIRFLSMKPEEFGGYDMSALLTESEILAVAMNLMSQAAPRAMPEGFSTSKERRVKGKRDQVTGIVVKEVDLNKYFVGNEIVCVQNILFKLNINVKSREINILFSKEAESPKLYKASESSTCRVLVQIRIESHEFSVPPFFREKEVCLESDPKKILCADLGTKGFLSRIKDKVTIEIRVTVKTAEE